MDRRLRLQPLTPGGVAAWASGPWAGLLLMELLMVTLAAGALVWFLLRAWCPVIHEAIGRLPDTGEIREQRLRLDAAPVDVLAANRFLALAVAVRQEPAIIPQADVVVLFRSEGLELCTLLGCLKWQYPSGYLIQFNRAELLPWWDAWRPVLLSGTGVATALAGWLLWNIVAAVYALALRLLPGWMRRGLTLAAGWKLASAALAPGVLVLVLGLILYGLGVVDWLRLGLMAGFQVLLGWIYLLTALPLVPLGPRPPPPSANPFVPPPSSPDSSR